MKISLNTLKKRNFFYFIFLYIFYQYIIKNKYLIYNKIYKLLYLIPFIKKKINKELQNSTKKLELELKTNYKNILKIPEYEYSKDSILGKIKLMENKKNYDKNKVSGIIYHGGKKHIDKLNEIFNKFSITNPLHPDLFPKIRNMEIDVINMAINLYKGDKNCCGNITYGGTESILLACLTYRDYYKNKKNIKAKYCRI